MADRGTEGSCKQNGRRASVADSAVSDRASSVRAPKDDCGRYRSLPAHSRRARLLERPYRFGPERWPLHSAWIGREPCSSRRARGIELGDWSRERIERDRVSDDPGLANPIPASAGRSSGGEVTWRSSAGAGCLRRDARVAIRSIDRASRLRWPEPTRGSLWSSSEAWFTPEEEKCPRSAI